MAEPRTSLEYFGFGHIQKKLDDLTRECESLKLQLDSCQGALREVIVENSANCDRADKAEQDFRRERAAYQMCSESREEIEAALAEAQEELGRLKELYVSFEEFDAWAEDAKSIDFQIIVTPTGVELVAKNPWPAKAVITGGLLELKDLQHMQNEPGGIKINAANGWARYKEVVSAKRLFGVTIDFYGFELLESEWEEPK